MIRLVPRNLAGRLMVVLGLALLVAQLVSFALILNERQKLSLVQNIGPAVTRFAAAATDISDAAPQFRDALVSDLSHRGAHFRLGSASGIPSAKRSDAVERRLAEALSAAGFRVGAVRAADSTVAVPARGGERRSGPRRMLALEAQLQSGLWLSGEISVPARDPWLTARLAAATLVLFLIVLGASFLVIGQVTKPLHALTSAAERFRGRAEPDAVPLAGPDDVRAAIAAFNEMNAQLLRLLDDKDRVLGAIGHDLRTPLASLRIRLEQMGPDDEREAAVRKVEEMAAILEDILMLAETGRARGAARPAEISSIVEAVVEEFRDLGGDVRLEPSSPQVLEVHPNLLRRALANLVDNGLKYGESVRVALHRSPSSLSITVSDSGPGIDPAMLSRVQEPFFRGEESRNRHTGGSGLGLAIARSIIALHDGELTLRNGPTGGLVAEITLPVSPPGDRIAGS